MIIKAGFPIIFLVQKDKKEKYEIMYTRSNFFKEFWIL
jgi:hypothetical protein